jgi:hypothetical protein
VALLRRIMVEVVLETVFRAVVVAVGILLMALALVVNGLTGWVASALIVWSVWTHHVSSIPGWLLSTAIVAAAVLLVVLSVAIPGAVKGFLRSVPVGLIAGAVVALATAQWLPALTLGIGAILARAVRAGAQAVKEQEQPHT